MAGNTLYPIVVEVNITNPQQNNYSGMLTTLIGIG